MIQTFLSCSTVYDLLCSMYSWALCYMLALRYSVVTTRSSEQSSASLFSILLSPFSSFLVLILFSFLSYGAYVHTFIAYKYETMCASVENAMNQICMTWTFFSLRFSFSISFCFCYWLLCILYSVFGIVVYAMIRNIAKFDCRHSYDCRLQTTLDCAYVRETYCCLLHLSVHFWLFGIIVFRVRTETISLNILQVQREYFMEIDANIHADVVWCGAREIDGENCCATTTMWTTIRFFFSHSFAFGIERWRGLLRNWYFIDICEESVTLFWMAIDEICDSKSISCEKWLSSVLWNRLNHWATERIS